MDNNGFEHCGNHHHQHHKDSKIMLEMQATNVTHNQLQNAPLKSPSPLLETALHAKVENATTLPAASDKRHYCEPNICHPKKLSKNDGNWNRLKTIFFLSIIFSFVLWLIDHIIFDAM